MRAATDNCDLIVLPEMFNTGFSMDLAAVADEGIGETTFDTFRYRKKRIASTL